MSLSTASINLFKSFYKNKKHFSVHFGDKVREYHLFVLLIGGYVGCNPVCKYRCSWNPLTPASAWEVGLLPLFVKGYLNCTISFLPSVPSLRTGNECDSNLLQLLKIRGEDDPRVKVWLRKKSNKYKLADIHNEILKTTELHILWQVAESSSSAPFLASMVDETIDSFNKEQVFLLEVFGWEFRSAWGLCLSTYMWNKIHKGLSATPHFRWIWCDWISVSWEWRAITMMELLQWLRLEGSCSFDTARRAQSYSHTLLWALL